MLDHFVTLAGLRFQSFDVKQMDHTAGMFDQPLRFQNPCRYRDQRCPRTPHIGNTFMRKRQR